MLGLPSTDSLILTSFILLVLGAYSVRQAFRQRTLFSGTGGFHLNVIILFGIGPLAYLFMNDFIASVADRVPRGILLAYMAQFSEYILYGYGIWCLAERYLPRAKPVAIVSVARSVSPELMGVLFALGVAGYFVSRTNFAQSGIGTIFIVAKLMMYPTLVLAILKFNSRDTDSQIVLGMVLTTLFVQSFFSGWRSEFVLLVFGSLIAIAHRSPRIVSVLAPTIFLVMVVVVLPVLENKKKDYESFLDDPIEMMTRSVTTPFETRLENSAFFAGIRTNGLREAAYVGNGLDENLIKLRHGETYLESLLQLIPRAVWADKPSYILSTGRELPRDIGLLSKNDPGTNWGVHVFAELIWNFGGIHLIWFVPVMFTGFYLIDRQFQYMYRSIQVRLLASLVMFFLALNFVGLVIVTTYVLWILILMKVVDMAVPDL